MNLEYFIVVLAWVFAPLSTFYFGAMLYWNATYPGSLEETLDRYQGFTKSWNPTKPFIVAVICWAYIVAYYFG